MGTIIRSLFLSAMMAVASSPYPAAALSPPCSLVQPCRLDEGMPASFSPQRPTLSPDGDTAVFTHRKTGNSEIELYSVPVRGGADPVRLDSPRAPVTGKSLITSDSRRVLYLSQRPAGLALFSVPINGPASAAVRIAPSVLGGSASVQVTRNSRLVVVLTATRRVRAVPVAGPERNAAVLTDTGVVEFGVSANSRNVVYSAPVTGGERELFRVPLTLTPDPGQEPTRLSGPMVDGGGVRSFRLPTGTGPVIYAAAQDAPNRVELFRVGLGGGNRSKLNVAFPTGWQVGTANDHPDDFKAGYGISPNGLRVVYEIRAIGAPTLHRLYSVPSAGPAGASRRIDVTTPNTGPAIFHITGDSRHVVYPVVDVNAGPERAFGVPIDGPAAARVEVSMGGEDGGFVQVSPDGRRVVSRGPIFAETALLSSPPDEAIPGPSLLRLNGSETPTGSVAFDPLGRRAAYVARVGTGEPDVYSSALESRSRFNLTATLSKDFITNLVASDQHAVYVASDLDDQHHLYSSRLVPGSSG